MATGAVQSTTSGRISTHGVELNELLFGPANRGAYDSEDEIRVADETTGAGMDGWYVRGDVKYVRAAHLGYHKVIFRSS